MLTTLVSKQQSVISLILRYITYVLIINNIIPKKCHKVKTAKDAQNISLHKRQRMFVMVCRACPSVLKISERKSSLL